MFDKLKAKGQKLKGEIAVLYLVARDPRTPWYAKMIVAFVLAYGLSPIDLIPDFIPVLGYVDDLILLPAGIYLALKLIPPIVVADARQRATELNGRLRKNWLAAAVIVVLWIATAILLGSYFMRTLNTETQSLIGAEGRAVKERSTPTRRSSIKLLAVAFPDARQTFRTHRHQTPRLAEHHLGSCR